jgi:hypothetical protein
MAASSSASGWGGVAFHMLAAESRTRLAQDDLAVPQPKKKVTRPSGVLGGPAYRRNMNELWKEWEAEEHETQQADKSHNHGIHHARSCRTTVSRMPEDVDNSTVGHGIVKTLRPIGTCLQQKLGLAATTTSNKREASFADNDDRDLCTQLLFHANRPVASLKADSASTNTSQTTLKRRALECASALVNSAGYLWGITLCRIADLISQGLYKGVLLIKKRRYDETPSRVRVHDKDSQTMDGTTAKVMQSEFYLGILLQHVTSGKYAFIKGHVPTWLQVMQRTTAEVIKATQEDIEAVVPELDRLAPMFDMSLHMVNTDSFLANFKAERGVKVDHPDFTLSHYGCDIHRVGTCQGKQFSLVDGHVSGMISGSLAMLDAGSTHSFRAAMMTVIEGRLDLKYGDPPQGSIAEYRHQVHDLFLRLPDSANGRSHRRTFKQRLILSAFLTGDLEDHTCVTVWTNDLELDRDAVLLLIKQKVIPALVPSKAPMFPRSKWTNVEKAIDFFGLIDAHHGLLEPTVMLYTKTKQKPELGVVGWAFCAADFEVDEPAATEVDEDGDGEQPAVLLPVAEAATAGNHETPLDSTTGNVDWAAFNLKMKAKFAEWSQMQPCSILAIMRGTMLAPWSLMNTLLETSGEQWEKSQQLLQAKGQSRSYRIVEAFHQRALHSFRDTLHDSFHSCPKALPISGHVRNLQVLSFRMLSCIGASVNFNIQLNWQSYPVKLFCALKICHSEEQVLAMLADPECMLDELSAAILAKFPTADELLGDEAQCILQGIASLFTMDIAAIEARHASTRRIIHVSGVQTHMPALDRVSAQWACRRNGVNRKSALPQTVKSGKAKKVKKDGFMVKPGGPWRAFMNDKSAGKQFSGEGVAQLSQMYAALNGEEMAKYVEIGRLATMSGKRGHKPFGAATSSVAPIVSVSWFCLSFLFIIPLGVKLFFR